MANCFACLIVGTFARVWLARLKDQKDKNKVYALKILRKADGEHELASWMHVAPADMLASDQIEAGGACAQ